MLAAFVCCSEREGKHSTNQNKQRKLIKCENTNTTFAAFLSQRTIVIFPDLLTVHHSIEGVKKNYCCETNMPASASKTHTHLGREDRGERSADTGGEAKD